MSTKQRSFQVKAVPLLTDLLVKPSAISHNLVSNGALDKTTTSNITKASVVENSSNSLASLSTSLKVLPKMISKLKIFGYPYLALAVKIRLPHSLVHIGNSF